MDLKGIIAISGKPGLYKVAAQGRNNIIVHSLENDKKFPAFASDKISALDDISFYTYDKDMPLVEVFTLLAEKEDFKTSINHKEEARKLREYLVTFLPTYDAERVYDTDVKKLFQWYNILVEKGFISRAKLEEAAAATAAEEESKPKAKKAAKDAGAEAAGTKPKAKKAPAKKSGEETPKKKESAAAKDTAEKKKSAKKS
jgi:hypothetical protein